jgi:hypothetical protein
MDSAREWGVCIAVRDGLAYQPVKLNVILFAARVIQGSLIIPTKENESINLEIIGVYAPAKEEHKPDFWAALTTHVTNTMKRLLSDPTSQLILTGDWNSYINPEREIYRTITNGDLQTTPPTSEALESGYLNGFLAELEEENLFLYDPMARQKLSAYDSYTFMSSSQRFRSILDKIFTSFPTSHLKNTIIIDWEHYGPLKLSDHRAVLLQISLHLLGNGWIEYPESPFALNPLIKLDKISKEQLQNLKTSIQNWRSTLPPDIARHLLQDASDISSAVETISSDKLAEMHTQLTDLFVHRTGKALNTGHNRRHRVYKTVDAGFANHVMVWLHKYKVSLTYLRDAKARGRRSLAKPERMQARSTYLDFQNEPKLREALSELKTLLPRETSGQRWGENDWVYHWSLASRLHFKWKKEYDAHLRTSKQAGKEKIQSKTFATGIGSKARRAYHLVHKNASSPLPALIKDPFSLQKMITGQAVNEYWGSTASATRPSTMPLESTETSVPPWLETSLWK